MRVFVDTSAWYALFVRGDAAHRRATQVLSRFRRGNVRLMVSDYIFSETVTLARSRVGHAAACRLGDHLMNSRVVEVAEVTAVVRGKAWDLFVGHRDQTFSFVDCTSFAIMRELGLTQAFAFDRHFAQMGFQVWPADQ